MVSLIERLGHLPSEVVGTTKYLWTGESEMPRLPLSTCELPFEERWLVAQNFSPFEAAEFVRQEILGLMPGVKERTGTKVYKQVRVGVSELTQSSLPPEIINYLLAPLHSGEYRGKWKNPEVRLELEAGFWTYKRSEASIGLRVEDSTKPMIKKVSGGMNDEGLGVKVWTMVEFDIGGRNVASCIPPSLFINERSLIGCFGDDEQSAQLRSSYLRPLYEALQRYQGDTPALLTARELVKFASRARKGIKTRRILE